MENSDNGNHLKEVLAVIDNWHDPKGVRKLLALILIGALLGGVGCIVYATGGTEFAYIHLMKLPILLSAFMFRIPGGIISGILAGIVVGPFMPLNVEAGLSQPTLSWTFRMGFFVLAGFVAGFLFFALNLRLRVIKEMVRTLSMTYTRTLKAFAFSVALREEQTGGHCERVAENACAVGQALGLDQNSIETLYWAGLLHDLGKIAVPEHILLKPGKLTGKEYNIMKRHVAAGEEMITSVSSEFAFIAKSVSSHHERWDGQGYPGGMKGKLIPVLGRILTVVDVFEALTSKRPYRDPMPAQEALSYLHEQSGSQFEPSIVIAFEELYQEGAIYLPGDTRLTSKFEAPIRFNEGEIYRRYTRTKRRTENNGLQKQWG